MDHELQRQFLFKTEDSGRFLVTSTRTGKTYAVEPILMKRGKGWGDLNPSTGETEGSYGHKYKGAISKDESLITEDNGFVNIETLDPGMSPLAYIDVLDSKYPDKL
jgi:hypothetical protein